MALSCIVLPVLSIPGGRPPSRVFLQTGAARPQAGRATLFSRTYRDRTIALCSTERISLAAVFLLTNWLPTIMTRTTGSAATASLLNSLIYFGVIVGFFLMGGIVNRVGPKRLLAIVFGVATAVCVVVHLSMSPMASSWARWWRWATV